MLYTIECFHLPGTNLVWFSFVLASALSILIIWSDSVADVWCIRLVNVLFCGYFVLDLMIDDRTMKRSNREPWALKQCIPIIYYYYYHHYFGTRIPKCVRAQIHETKKYWAKNRESIWQFIKNTLIWRWDRSSFYWHLIIILSAKRGKSRTTFIEYP